MTAYLKLDHIEAVVGDAVRARIGALRDGEVLVDGDLVVLAVLAPLHLPE